MCSEYSTTVIVSKGTEAGHHQSCTGTFSACSSDIIYTEDIIQDTVHGQNDSRKCCHPWDKVFRYLIINLFLIFELHIHNRTDAHLTANQWVFHRSLTLRLGHTYVVQVQLVGDDLLHQLPHLRIPPKYRIAAVPSGKVDEVRRSWSYSWKRSKHLAVWK